MAIDREKAFETGNEHGILFEDGVSMSSGVAVPTHTADDGDIYLRRTTAEFYRRESGAWVLRTFGSGAQDGSIIHTSWADSLQNIVGLETPQETYEVVAHILYPGSVLVGVVSKIEITFMNENILDPLDVKIFDLTNAKTIVEKLNLAGAADNVFEVADLGSLANIPSAMSVFELQIRQVDGTAPGPVKPSFVSTVLMRLT